MGGDRTIARRHYVREGAAVLNQRTATATLSVPQVGRPSFVCGGRELPEGRHEGRLLRFLTAPVPRGFVPNLFGRLGGRTRVQEEPHLA